MLQFVVRQSGWLALYFFIYSAGCSIEVISGLWSGSGLHGYVIHQGKTRNGYIVPVWQSFEQAIVFAALSCTMLGVKIWHTNKTGRIDSNLRRKRQI